MALLLNSFSYFTQTWANSTKLNFGFWVGTMKIFCVIFLLKCILFTYQYKIAQRSIILFSLIFYKIMLVICYNYTEQRTLKNTFAKLKISSLSCDTSPWFSLSPSSGQIALYGLYRILQNFYLSTYFFITKTAEGKLIAERKSNYMNGWARKIPPVHAS